MRFSILIPVFNTEKYLDLCLQSVLKQNYSDFEIILTDDGSTDGSRKICEKYASSDSRIKFFSRENKGLLATRREQLKICSGDYVLFLDSDDYWEDGILSVLSETIDKKTPDLICFGYNSVDDDSNLMEGNLVIYDNEKEFSTAENNISSFIKKFFEDYSFCYLWSKCVKREIIDIDNSYEEFSDVFGEDLLQATEIVCNSKSVIYLNQALYNYRQSVNGKGRNLSPEFAIDTMIIRNYIYERILFHNLGKEILDAFLIRSFKSIIHRLTCLTILCKNFREFSSYQKKMKTFPVFNYATRTAFEKNRPTRNFKSKLLIYHPLAHWIFRKIRKRASAARAIKNNYLYNFKAWCLYLTNRSRQKQLPLAVYKSEYKKYIKCLKTDIRKDLVYAQLKAFLKTSFNLISDNLSPSEDRLNPIVFAVVRNELNRMKVFFEHYRKLGVNQFVILDNGSTDGTLEFLSEQEGTKVYQILEPFQTQKKESWIEKLLIMNGLNRWCIVVDSDELLDYPGSENHSLKEMIQKSDELGHKRIWGFMLDMYAKEPLFSQNETEIPFTSYLRYFDRSSYLLNNTSNPRSTRLYDEIYGGPRFRMFKKGMTLSKQAIFYFENDLLYRSCHFMYPLIKWGDVPCWFVLRHYKFIPSDKAEYQRRIREKCFYNNSIEYKNIMDQINSNQEISMYFEGSQKYVDSTSLLCLPYLQKITW